MDSAQVQRPILPALRWLMLITLLVAGVSAKGDTIAFWKFDAADPTADASGNNNTLALNGNITFSSDVATNATGTTNSAAFDGASYAQTLNTLNLTNYKQLTVEFFGKYTPNQGLQMFYSQNNPNNTVGAFYFDMNEPTGNLKVSLRSVGGFNVDTAPQPQDGAWHHYALTIDQSTNVSAYKIYVDGYEVDGTGSTGQSTAFINDFFTIGAYPPTYVFNYAGLMGEMRISSGILQPSQFLIGTQIPIITISRQPQNRFTLTNMPVTFTIAAAAQGGSPTPPLMYQWQRNGVSIPGATNSSYTLPSPLLSDNLAQFDVLLTAPPASPVISSNATLIVATNPTVAYWKFDAANPTVDSSGYTNTLAFNGNITFSSDVATNATGTTNSAVFDGASFMQTLQTFDLTLFNQLTIEFFAKYTPDNGLQMFYSQNNPNNVFGAFYFDMNEPSGTLKFAQRFVNGGFNVDTAPQPQDGDWHHYALTMDESTNTAFFKIYVDGYQVDSGATGFSTPFINDFFTIGAYPPNYIFNYAGLMGEMRVSKGILSPSQFLIGAPPPKITITQQPLNTGVAPNSPAMFNVAATVQGGTSTNPPITYQWQRNGVNISGATNASYTLQSPTLADNGVEFDVVLSVDQGSPVTSTNALLTVLTNGVIAFWKFDTSDPTADSSGNGNTLGFNGNITFTNDIPASMPGISQSAVFDGASYAQTISTLDLTRFDQLTIEFFGKFPSGSPLQMFYSQNNPNNVQGAFYFDTGEAGPTSVKVSQRAGGLSFQTAVASEPTDQGWHHYALTMDESGAKSIFNIFVDGVRANGATGQSGSIQTFINDYFTLGAYPPTYVFNYSGLMTGLRISTGILSPSQFLTGPALLSSSLTNGNIVVAWPANANGFTLEQAVTVSGVWSPVTNAPVVISGYNTVTVPATGVEKFFRLSR